MMRRFVYLFGLAGMLLLTRSVEAHANLVESTPGSNTVIARVPDQARLRFSEPLEPSYSHVVLVDAEDKQLEASPSQVDDGDAHVLLLRLPPLAGGRYTLKWRTVSSVDGHTTEGVVPFAIGDATAANAPLVLPQSPDDPLALPAQRDVQLRWTMLIAVSLAMGSLIFGGYVWQADPGGPQVIEQQFGMWTRRLEVSAAGLATLVTTALLIVTSAAAQTPVVALVADSRVGMLLGVRAGLCVFWIVALQYLRGGARRMLGLGIGGSMLLTLSLLSHSAAPQNVGGTITSIMTPILAIAFDWAHLVATAAWLGGLVPLLLALVALRRVEESVRARIVSALIMRFTALATASVIALAATGTYATLQHVAQVSQLWTTAYGRVLAFKLGLFGVLLLLGGYNRWAVHPRLEALLATDIVAGKSATLLRHLRRSVSVELGAGLLVLFSAGILTAAPPAREAVAMGTDLPHHARVGGARLTLQVVRNPNAGELFALDVVGLPADARREVVLRVLMPAHATEEQELALTELEPGRWGGRGVVLTMDGLWHVTVIVRTPGMDDLRHTFTVDTTGSPKPTMSAPPAWSPLLVGALLLAASSLLPTQRRWRLHRQFLGLLVAFGLVAESLTAMSGPRTAKAGANKPPDHVAPLRAASAELNVTHGFSLRAMRY